VGRSVALLPTDWANFNHKRVERGSYLPVIPVECLAPSRRQTAGALVDCRLRRFGALHWRNTLWNVLVLDHFMGWLFGKSMLETKGFFWAWFLHFVSDVLVLAFTAMASIGAVK
jgi:hypothetical protein